MDKTQLTIAVATASGVLFAIVTGTLGLVLRITFKWAKLESKVDQLSVAFTDEHTRSERQRDLLREEIREDRHASNARLTYLERQRMGT